MDYKIEYYSEDVQDQILALPDTLAARYIVLTRRMAAIGANLGPPHTESFGDGLFELREIELAQAHEGGQECKRMIKLSPSSCAGPVSARKSNA